MYLDFDESKTIVGFFQKDFFDLWGNTPQARLDLF